MLKNSQTNFKNLLGVHTARLLKMFDHFSTLFMKGLNRALNLYPIYLYVNSLNAKVAIL